MRRFFRRVGIPAVILALLAVPLASCDVVDALDDSSGPAGRRAKTGDARCFDTFHLAKKYLHDHGTPRRSGWQWHHIVGQHRGNVDRFGARNLHCTDNLIYLDSETHKNVSSRYLRKYPFTGGKRLYEWLAARSFDDQYSHGIQVLERYGVAP